MPPSALTDNDKSPSRKTGELDNRGASSTLAMYWAQELAAQTDDQQLAEHFASLADVTKNEDVHRARKLTEYKANHGGHRRLLRAGQRHDYG